jgi:phosphatidylglycerophosphate synthase
MLGQAKAIYLATRKKHDLVFNVYFMRPIAAAIVAVVAKTPVTPNQLTLLNLFIFIAAAALFVAMPSYVGGLAAVLVLEVSYCFDCADGMLARHKKIASKEGHLFDFFTDELKAVLLAAVLSVRLYRTGGLGLDLTTWPSHAPAFLFAGIAGSVVLASAISLTNFIRRPELSGRESTVEAHYETVVEAKPKSVAGRAASLVTMFLRFLNHYPSHLWAWSIAGRLDLFFWIYVAINFLYLARGWLGIVLRFGRPAKSV